MLREAKIKKAFKDRNLIDECKLENLDLDEDMSVGLMSDRTEK